MTTAVAEDVDILQILNDPEMRFWHLVHELADLGAHHHRLTGKLDRITAQLADETRGTAQERAEATLRREKWVKAREGIEWEAKSLTGWIASVWWQLPASEKARLQSMPDWPAETVAPKLANALWTMAKAGQPIPGCAPF